MATPIQRPLAVFVGEAGGALDTLASDPDVTTFLNDKFHPYFFTPSTAPDLPQGITFLDAEGCAFAAPALPKTPSALIALANDVVDPPPGHSPVALPVPLSWGFDLSPWPTHPLRAMCARLR